MKIYTQGYNESKQGGGHSFLRNFRKCFKDNIVDDPKDCDIYFITSVSMLNKLSEIPKDKKIVLRVDNILKKSCNSDMYPFKGNKVSRMVAMRILAQKADLVIYQSEWAKNLLDGFLRPSKSVVILNSADENIFNPDGGQIPVDRDIYFYSRSSNHDNKAWYKAYYWYIEEFRKNPDSELWITGRFSPENIPNSFDFFQGETIKYLGYVTDPEAMAMYFRTCRKYIYTYEFDACSNTLVEAMLCGAIIEMLSLSGGSGEIVRYREDKDYFKLPRMKQEYKTAMEAL